MHHSKSKQAKGEARTGDRNGWARALNSVEFRKPESNWWKTETNA